MSKRCVLALEDGQLFEGHSFGAAAEAGGEVVFHTSPFGYQEILTDPSYVGQIVTMAATQMGNVGTNGLDDESGRPRIAGMVVREYSERASSWRSQGSLHEWLNAAGVPGLHGVDTRKLVRHLRTHGSKRGVLSTESVSAAALIERARAVPDMEGQDLATPISTRTPYEFTRPLRHFEGSDPARHGVIGSPIGSARKSLEAAPLHVVAYDYGLKATMLELLVDAGCRVTVVPAGFPAEQVLALRPDGVFLTNGPGDPAAVAHAQERIRTLLGKVPLFGICLGHQLLALALGGRTFKMKFGHRGANHPVQDLATGKVEITSQNHGFAVDADSLAGKAVVTHLNLNDGTVEGLAAPELQAFSVQYHPESSPGPHDARHLFARFVRLMRPEGGQIVPVGAARLLANPRPG